MSWIGLFAIYLIDRRKYVLKNSYSKWGDVIVGVLSPGLNPGSAIVFDIHACT